MTAKHKIQIQIFKSKMDKIFVGSTVVYNGKTYKVEKIVKCAYQHDNLTIEDPCRYCVGEIQLNEYSNSYCYCCGFECDFDEITPPELIKEAEFKI